MNAPVAFPFVDSHAHLTDAAFDADREQVIERAKAAGCRAIVCIGATIADAERALVLAAAHPGFLAATAGVHPHEASAFDAVRDAERIREFVARGAVGIGECGLDYHYDNSPRDVQRRVFDAHIALAAETRRPVIVHTRNAESDTIDVLRAAKSAVVLGVLHCFSGGPALAEAALDAGWFISFAGVVTFKKWDGDALIRLVPGDRLLVETDAPYLAPVPHRGKRNEPAFAARTVERIAEARGDDAARIGALSVANATRCFGLVPPAAGV